VFPENYIEQPMHRLDLYQRLSAAETDDAILQVFSEIHGLYGHPPDEVGHLSEVMLMRLRLKRAGASALSVAFGEEEVRLGVTLLPESPVDRAALVQLVQRDPRHFGVTASGRLTLRAPAPRSAAPRELLRIARQTLAKLPA
jgi:transcription-repair coupling factor (superfamily II helicase)